MKSITISLTDIRAHGLLRATILELVRTHRLRSAHEISEELVILTTRAIDTELTAMHRAKLIEYISKSHDGKKLVFIL